MAPPADAEDMNLQLIGDIALAAILLGWIGYRQTTWRPVSTAGMLRMAVILGVVGVGLLAPTTAGIGGLDIAVMLVELVISLGIGAWMGALARFRPLDPPVPVGRSGRLATVESRTGWWGLVLWLVMIAVRIGMDAGAAALGAHIASSTGVILLMLAANRLARGAAIAARVQRLTAVEA